MKFLFKIFEIQMNTVLGVNIKNLTKNFNYWKT